jgi:hypothetical protein
MKYRIWETTGLFAGRELGAVLTRRQVTELPIMDDPKAADKVSSAMNRLAGDLFSTDPVLVSLPGGRSFLLEGVEE